jgi:hypothetical protein
MFHESSPLPKYLEGAEDRHELDLYLLSKSSAPIYRYRRSIGTQKFVCESYHTSMF